MSKTVYAIVAIVAVLSACSPFHGSQTPHTSAASDLESKTVALVMADEDGGARPYCSGVWVGEASILTANHCVADEEIDAKIAYVTRGDVSASDGDKVQAVRLGSLVARDADHDLALIRVKLAPKHEVAFVGDAPRVGDLTQTMGHPRGLWWSYSAGNVAAVRVLETDEYPAMWWVQSTAPISPGNSGGGLFDSHGDLIGIAHSYVPSRAENINLYVDSRYVRAFLRDAQ